MLTARHGRIAVLVVSAALVAIACVPTFAYAADAKYPSNWSEFLRMQAMPAMHMMDSDKKGYVTKEEFMKFQEEFFSRMDKDHDGKVTGEEWVGHKPAKKGAAKAQQGAQMGADKTEGGGEK